MIYIYICVSILCCLHSGALGLLPHVRQAGLLHSWVRSWVCVYYICIVFASRVTSGNGCGLTSRIASRVTSGNGCGLTSRCVCVTSHIRQRCGLTSRIASRVASGNGCGLTSRCVCVTSHNRQRCGLTSRIASRVTSGNGCGLTSRIFVYRVVTRVCSMGWAASAGPGRLLSCLLPGPGCFCMSGSGAYECSWYDVYMCLCRVST
jgi:hypothetical protein